MLKNPGGKTDIMHRQMGNFQRQKNQSNANAINKWKHDSKMKNYISMLISKPVRVEERNSVFYNTWIQIKINQNENTKRIKKISDNAKWTKIYLIGNPEGKTERMGQEQLKRWQIILNIIEKQQIIHQ